MVEIATKFQGLGQNVTTAETIQDAITQANLDWEVALEPLQGIITKKPVDRNAVLRLDNQEHLGVVGSSYEPLQNKDVFDWFNPFIEQGFVQLETAGCFYGGKKIFVLGKIKMDDLEVQKNDVVQSYILLSNSHDGTTSVRVGFTPFRVWCTNTLKLAIRDKATQLIRVKHTQQVKENITAIGETMDVINQQFITTAEKYKWLATRDIKQTDLEKYVRAAFSLPSLEEIAKSDGDSKKGRKIIDYVTERMDYEDNRNWWTAYNSVQHYMQHNGNDYEKNLNNLWFGNNDSKNQKALNLALELAT